MQPKTTHVYKKVQDLDIMLDVYQPETGTEGSPVLVLLHGGGLINGDRNMYKPTDPANEHFFQVGATVITVDYRLAPETKLPQIIEDLQDCMKWVHTKGKELYGYDTNNLIVAGHSAGGYLTMMAGFCLEIKPKALIAYYGYGDITGDWYTKPDPFYLTKKRQVESTQLTNKETTCNYDGRGNWGVYLYYRQNGLWTQEVSGVNPQMHPTFHKQYEPIQNISKDYPPILMFHGDKDTDVPYQKSVDMNNALTKAGIKSTLITIKDGCHAFDIRQLDSPQTKQTNVTVKQFITDTFYTH